MPDEALRQNVERLMKEVFNGGTSLSSRMTRIETKIETVIGIALAGFVVIPGVYLLFRWLLGVAGVHLGQN